MIFSLVLIDAIYSIIFTVSSNSIFYILLIGNRKVKLITVLLSLILDLCFKKIFLLPLLIILLILGNYFPENNNVIKKILFLFVYFIIIFIYLNKTFSGLVLNLLINVLIYFIFINNNSYHINY